MEILKSPFYVELKFIHMQETILVLVHKIYNGSQYTKLMTSVVVCSDMNNILYNSLELRSPAGTQRQNDVVLTSIRRHQLATTSKRRQLDFMCMLGEFACI